jgi:hypothetical protein
MEMTLLSEPGYGLVREEAVEQEAQAEPPEGQSVQVSRLAELVEQAQLQEGPVILQLHLPIGLPLAEVVAEGLLLLVQQTLEPLAQLPGETRMGALSQRVLLERLGQAKQEGTLQVLLQMNHTEEAEEAVVQVTLPPLRVMAERGESMEVAVGAVEQVVVQ